MDIASKKVIDNFRLSEGNKKARIFGFRADPLNRFMVVLTKTASKQVDHFDISAPTLHLYDLRSTRSLARSPGPTAKNASSPTSAFRPMASFSTSSATTS